MKGYYNRGKMNILFNQKELTVNNNRISFSHEIKDISVLSDKIIVLLDIPYSDNDTINNIYAVSYMGKIIWRSEDLKQLYPKQINLPYDYITVYEDIVQAVDFYGRRYFINVENGYVIGRDIVK